MWDIIAKSQYIYQASGRNMKNILDAEQQKISEMNLNKKNIDDSIGLCVLQQPGVKWVQKRRKIST